MSKPSHHSEYGGGPGANRYIPAAPRGHRELPDRLTARPLTPSEQLKADFRAAHGLPSPDDPGDDDVA